MKVLVKAKPLKQVFSDFLSGRKVMFNFKCDGKKLYIQILEDFIVNCWLEVESLDNDYSTIDVSCYITKVVNILGDDDITLELTEQNIRLTQSDFSYVLIKEFEGRRDYEVPTDAIFEKANISRLKYLMRCATSMSTISKELKVFESDPIFRGGNFYQKYNSTAFRESFNFPECSINMSTVKAIIFKLSDDTTYYHYHERNMIVFKSYDYVIWVPLITYNSKGNELNAVDSKISECKECAKINLYNYLDKLKIVKDTNPSTKIGFTIGSNGFTLSLDTTNVHLTIGNALTDYICTISMTTAQLATMCAIFNEDEIVTVLRGENCLCLRTGKTRNLLILGMLF